MFSTQNDNVAVPWHVCYLSTEHNQLFAFSVAHHTLFHLLSLNPAVVFFLLENWHEKWWFYVYYFAMAKNWTVSVMNHANFFTRIFSAVKQTEKNLNLVILLNVEESEYMAIEKAITKHKKMKNLQVRSPNCARESVYLFIKLLWRHPWEIE